MKKQVFNPYLPLDTYIPDGEPHVFGDRVYIYGSHDKEGGDNFCLLDYECWSAPVNDLSDWRCEGIIYQAKQCPHYSEVRQDLYALMLFREMTEDIIFTMIYRDEAITVLTDL